MVKGVKKLEKVQESSPLREFILDLENENVNYDLAS